jgi:hypothetical protein
MSKNRKNTIPVLMDIGYKYSMNKFEENYGEQISYSEIEQESYIDLKSMVFEKISRSIKFRKFNREKNKLTLKADMLNEELQLFKDILNNKIVDEKATKDKKNNPSGKEIFVKFHFIHDFAITNVRIMTKEDLIKAKKTIPEVEEYSENPTFVELDEDMEDVSEREEDFE